MAKQRPFPYQVALEESLRVCWRVRKRKRVVASLPVGGGKTTVASRIAQASLRGTDTRLSAVMNRDDPGWIVGAVAHRSELIYQFHQRFAGAGMVGGIIQAGHEPDYTRALQVCSVATLIREKRLRQFLELCRGRKVLLIVDECHRTLGQTYLDVIAAVQAVAAVLYIVGLTATPYRLDGQGLGDVYDDLIEGPTPKHLYDYGLCKACWSEVKLSDTKPRIAICTGPPEMPHSPEKITRSFLVRPTFYRGPAPDMTGAQKRGGDYATAEVARRAGQVNLVGDIVANYERLCSGRTGIAFAVDRAHAQMIADQFNDKAKSFRRPVTNGGEFAAYLDGTKSPDERASILARLSIGAFKIVSNCAVLIEGWDPQSDYERVCDPAHGRMFWSGKSSPPPYIPISMAIDACPTLSMNRWIQGPVGRTSRGHDDKDGAHILDHAGNLYRFGLPEYHYGFDLDGLKKRGGGTSAPRMGEVQGLVDCLRCGACYDVGQYPGGCPYCGAAAPTTEERASRRREVVTVDTELQQTAGEDLPAQRAMTTPERENLYVRLMADVVRRRTAGADAHPRDADSDFLTQTGQKPTPPQQARVWRQFGFAALLRANKPAWDT